MRIDAFSLQSVSGCEYLVITPDRSLVFPSVEYVRAIISKQGMREGTAVPVVIDSTHIQVVDFTAAKVNRPLGNNHNMLGITLISTRYTILYSNCKIE